MITIKKILGVAAAIVVCTALPLRGQIAVTEFMNDPNGADSQFEWVELFNYSASAVDTSNWTLSDDGTDQGTLSGFIMGSGEFAILARSKIDFESRWFGGVAQANVFDFSSLSLANTQDEIVLQDGDGNEVWRIVYGDDESARRATFLTDSDFSLTTHNVVRDGLDGSGLLGYQDNNRTIDNNAFNSNSLDFASPLLGDYLVVPEPAGIAVILGLLSLAGAVSRRKRSILGQK